jgi:transposase
MREESTRDDRASRECPLCGSTMRLKESQAVTQIPGNPAPTVRQHREWICPDCDYFEEPG